MTGLSEARPSQDETHGPGATHCAACEEPPGDGEALEQRCSDDAGNNGYAAFDHARFCPHCIEHEDLLCAVCGEICRVCGDALSWEWAERDHPGFLVCANGCWVIPDEDVPGDLADEHDERQPILLRPERGSSPETATKQRDVRAFFDRHLLLVDSIFKKVKRGVWVDWNPWPWYLYAELNAGSGSFDARKLAGLSPELCFPGPQRVGEPRGRGSPLLAYRLALDHGVRMRLLLCEKDPDAAMALLEALVDEHQDFHRSGVRHDPTRCIACPRDDRWLAAEQVVRVATVLVGDHVVTIPQFLADHPDTFGPQVRRRLFGLIYADACGILTATRPLVALSQVPSLQKVEILINVGATTYKRVRGAATSDQLHGRPARYHAGSLFADLAPIEREHWWIREPLGKQQWIMLLGTNSKDVRPARWGGWHRVGSPEGQALIERTDRSANERQQEDES